MASELRSEAPCRRGKLKVYLGYAAGVGKTYQMLEEAQELRRRGVDIVIGYFEPHGRADTIARTEGLETVPRRTVEYRGSRFEEMDTEAIRERRPAVALVDEFAHTNIPGSAREKRWQDVLALIEAGIDVLTTMNIQHLDSLNDQVWQMTGVRVRETVPDWVIKEAAEVVMVDLTPRALLNRLERGVVYSPDKARRAVENFFKEPTLAALREMALRQTAHEVDLRQAAPPVAETAAAAAPGFETPHQHQRESILIVLTADPATAALIRRGRRVADYLHAECRAVTVMKDMLAPLERDAVDRHLTFARNLHIDTDVLEGSDVAETLVEFARTRHVTQIYVMRPKQMPRLALPGRSLVHDIVRLARDIRVVIVAERR